MDKGKRHVNLLLELEARGFIPVPTGVSVKTLKILERNGLKDKAALRKALDERLVTKLPGVGEVTRREIIRYLIFGDDSCPHCGK